MPHGPIYQASRFRKAKKVAPQALLLDGQQRMTSLYQVTIRRKVVETVTSKNKKVKRWFYIDIRKALADGLDREEAIVGVPEDRVSRKEFDRITVLDLSSSQREYEQLMFPLTDVFDLDAWQDGFDEFWRGDANESVRKEFRLFKKAILENFKSYQVPVIALDRFTSKEAVCVVFEKVNTGGKPLDAFELVTAMYAADGHELRKDWYGNGTIPGRQQRFINTLRMGDTRCGIIGEVSNTDFLQAISLFYTRDRRREAEKAGKQGKDLPAISANRQALLNLPLSAYLQYEKQVERGFTRAAKFLHMLHIYRIFDLPYQSQLVPLAAILAEIGDSWEHEANRARLVRWYWNGVFGELYGSTVETRIAKDFIEVPKWLDGGPEPSTISETLFRPDRLKTMRMRLSAAYKGMNALLMKEGAQDWRSGQDFSYTVFFDENVDIHHIFPQDWCKKMGISPSIFDLPWNPNRIEQRFGRIHRIGQTQVCHLWNMLASETREGDVFHRLFEKLEIEREALGGRVFDILGEVFDEKSLKDLLIEAIRYGDDPERREELRRKVEGALDTDHLNSILNRNALSEEVMDMHRLFTVKEEMEKAEARKLQPYFIRAFFLQAFRQFGGEIQPREQGRYEIRNVPAIIRERDRQLSGRDRRNLNPVATRYERVCFEKQYVSLLDRPGSPMASLIHPAHPLMQAVTDLVLEQSRSKLKQGAVLIDPVDTGTEPRVMFLVDHSIRQGGDSGRTISRRVQFIDTAADGKAGNAGWAPHLDLQSASEADIKLIPDVLNAAWITQDLEKLAIEQSSAQLVPEHLLSVKERVQNQADRVLAAVQERLVKEINHWQNRRLRFQDEIAAGTVPKMSLVNVDRILDDLTNRLRSRQIELTAMKEVSSATPVVLGGALVIPAGLLAKRRGEPSGSLTWSADDDARKRIERRAMDAVIAAEAALGYAVHDVSAQKCGWDITSQPPATIEGALPEPRHIEVKGRIHGSDTITVTRNEILYGLNQQEKFILAIVLVNGDEVSGPHYVRRPFAQEPDWATTSVNLDLKQLLSRAEPNVTSEATR